MLGYNLNNQDLEFVTYANQTTDKQFWLCKPIPTPEGCEVVQCNESFYYQNHKNQLRKPPPPTIETGEKRYVKERFTPSANGYIYFADQNPEKPDLSINWKPGSHMPEKAARYKIELVSCEVIYLSNELYHKLGFKIV